MKYFSQYKQDEFVDFILNKRGGVFIDVGANDGITYSNSYYFEKFKQWRGICIEPIPETYKKLTEIRNCICMNCGIWSEEKELEFYRAHGYAEMLSGITESFNEQHYKRVKESIELHGGELETIKIKVFPLNKILKNNGLSHIDFCSIDTEGSEFEILKSIDFQNYFFNLFVIENQFDLTPIRILMREKGFRFIYRLGSDDFFLNNKIDNFLKIKSRVIFFSFWEKAKRIKILFK